MDILQRQFIIKMLFPHILCLLVCVSEVFSERKISPKIVGGSNVLSAKTYPYQVSLRYDSHFCGGSIIDNFWVLTAAHCVVNEIPHLGQYNFKVVAGTIDRRSYGITKSVSSVIIHPEYGGAFDHVNDIAVIRIIGYFTFTDEIKSIKLANDLPTPGSYATITGWGDIEFLGDKPSLLQYLSVPVIDLRECKIFWEGHVGVTVTDSNVCTLNPVTKEGVCHGDSGGPVAFNDEQIGVVSFGSLCSTLLPDGHTSVPAFKKWISETTGIEF